MYNTEVVLDASNAVIGRAWSAFGAGGGYKKSYLRGTRYRLCMDLDGTGSTFSFHDTGFSVYITPVSVVRYQVLVMGLSSRLELSCHGTGTVATSCSTASTVYLATVCDLTRATGFLGSWEVHSDDSTSTEPLSLGRGSYREENGARTAIPGAEGSAYEFRVEFNTTHLRVGASYRLCIDTDAAGGLSFGDSGYEVTMSGLGGIYPTTALQISRWG